MTARSDKELGDIERAHADVRAALEQTQQLIERVDRLIDESRDAGPGPNGSTMEAEGLPRLPARTTDGEDRAAAVPPACRPAGLGGD